MYNPKSVVESMLRHKFDTYWNQTETYEALKVYIQINMDGLKDAVVRMLAGESVEINTGTFTNDMTTFAGKDDVLTLIRSRRRIMSKCLRTIKAIFCWLESIMIRRKNILAG